MSKNKKWRYVCGNCSEVMGEAPIYFCSQACQLEWYATHEKGERPVLVQVDEEDKVGRFAGTVNFF